MQETILAIAIVAAVLIALDEERRNDSLNRPMAVLIILTSAALILSTLLP